MSSALYYKTLFSLPGFDGDHNSDAHRKVWMSISADAHVDIGRCACQHRTVRITNYQQRLDNQRYNKCRENYHRACLTLRFRSIGLLHSQHSFDSSEETGVAREHIKNAP